MMDPEYAIREIRGECRSFPPLHEY